MAEKSNKGSNLIITIIGVVTLLIAVIGTTFAYFSITIKNNPSNENKENKPINLGYIEFQNGKNLNYSNKMLDILNENEEFNNKIIFSIVSSNNIPEMEKTEYNVYFNITENTFNANNIVYYVNGTPSKNSDKINIKYGNVLDEYKTIYTPVVDNVPQYNQSLDVGYIPNNSGKKILIGQGKIGGASSQDDWSFEILSNENEIGEQEKILKGYISVEI